MPNRKALKKLKEMGEELGADVEVQITKAGRYKVVLIGPLGTAFVICSGAQQNRRTLANMKSTMVKEARRIGCVKD